MLGGYLLYKNGFPPGVKPYATGTQLDDFASPEELEKHKSYLKKSKLGFQLLFIGFILQVGLNIITCCFPNVAK
jgi:hypothetical protein